MITGIKSLTILKITPTEDEKHIELRFTTLSGNPLSDSVLTQFCWGNDWEKEARIELKLREYTERTG